jgi:hypothetical protein
MTTLRLASPFRIITKSKILDTNKVGIEQVLEVASCANIAVELKDITVNVAYFNGLKTLSTNRYKGVITKIAIKLIVGVQATFNLEQITNVVIVIILTLTCVIRTANLIGQIITDSIQIEIIVHTLSAVAYVF